MAHIERDFADTAIEDWLRSLVAPGVLHCGFGPGPNVFGNIGPRGKAEAAHDTLYALERWVEQGVAPEHIIATQYTDDDPRKPVHITLPMCSYPKVSEYDGKGDVNRSESYKCAAPRRPRDTKVPSSGMAGAP